LNIRFRDIKFVLSFMFSGLFFMTPIFYSIEIVTGNIKTIMQLNPFYILIKPFQEMLIYGPSILYYKLLISSVAITLLFVTGATFVWHKMKRNISLYG
jgi:ABC-type polysaccharide/polyol phosphate export permease